MLARALLNKRVDARLGGTETACAFDKERQKQDDEARDLALEALMPDGQAIQAGTSHFLGQNFAKAFDVTFKDQNNKEEFAYATSWGVSTRLIGTVIMAHGDDDGIILPPRIAPAHVVIIPVTPPHELARSPSLSRLLRCHPAQRVTA